MSKTSIKSKYVNLIEWLKVRNTSQKPKVTIYK